MAANPTSDVKLPDAPSLAVVEARLSDVKSLSTVFARSFHPVNAYMRRASPDTPITQQWWSEYFTAVIKAPSCHVLTARVQADDLDPQITDHNVSDEASPVRSEVYGVLILNLHQPGIPGTDYWNETPLSSDHDHELMKSMINASGKGRGKMMADCTYFDLELFGVDHALQGRGLGNRMVARACHFADEQNHDIFVTANHFARPFYERHGFECRQIEVMPGKEEYVECMMIRPVGGAPKAQS